MFISLFNRSIKSKFAFAYHSNSAYTKSQYPFLIKGIDNKKHLQKYLEEVLHVITYNSEARSFFQEKGLLDKDDSTHKKFYEYFFNFYDRLHGTELNVSDITTFTVDGVYYIKYRDKDGEYKVIENTQPDKSYIEQIEEKQKSSIYFQIGNSEDNKQAVLNKLTEERREVGLESTVDGPSSAMSQEEREYFETLVNHELFRDKNLIFNAQDNIYIDRDTGETYYVDVNSNGEKEIKKVNESYEVNGEVKTTNSEIPSNTDYSTLTDGDLYYLLENKSDTMTSAEVEKLKEEINKREREQQKSAELSKESKPKQYILDINKPYNGFASLMTLTLITSLYGIGFAIYLYLMIK